VTAIDGTVTAHHFDDLYLLRPLILLDLYTGRLWAAEAPEDGMTPMRQHRRIHVVMATPPAMRGDAVNGLLDELIPLAQIVLAGTDIRWDGHNSVGVFDADAEVVLSQAEALYAVRDFGDYRSEADVSEASAADWYGTGDDPYLGVTADTTDEEIQEIADREDGEAMDSPEHMVIVVGTYDYLVEHRDDLIKARDEAVED
jgi:hypothetical protein